MVNIQINSGEEKLSGLSIELLNFTTKEYNNYYPNDVNYKENETIFTLHFEGNKDFIKDIYDNHKDDFAKIFESNKNIYSIHLSIRKGENKLFLILNQKKKYFYIYTNLF